MSRYEMYCGSLYKLAIRSILRGVYKTHTRDEQQTLPDDCRVCKAWGEQEAAMFDYYNQCPSHCLNDIWTTADVQNNSNGGWNLLCFFRLFLGKGTISIRFTWLEMLLSFKEHKPVNRQKAASLLGSVMEKRGMVLENVTYLLYLDADCMIATEVVSKQPTIRSLELLDFKYDKPGPVIEQIGCTLSQLQSLTIDNDHIQFGDVVVGNVEFEGSCLLHLIPAGSAHVGCPKLTHLDINGCDISVNVLKALMLGLKNLQDTERTRVIAALESTCAQQVARRATICAVTAYNIDLDMLTSENVAWYKQNGYVINLLHVKSDATSTEETIKTSVSGLEDLTHLKCKGYKLQENLRAILDVCGTKLDSLELRIGHIYCQGNNNFTLSTIVQTCPNLSNLDVSTGWTCDHYDDFGSEHAENLSPMAKLKTLRLHHPRRSSCGDSFAIKSILASPKLTSIYTCVADATLHVVKDVIRYRHRIDPCSKAFPCLQMLCVYMPFTIYPAPNYASQVQALILQNCHNAEEVKCES